MESRSAFRMAARRHVGVHQRLGVQRNHLPPWVAARQVVNGLLIATYLVRAPLKYRLS